MLPSNIMSQLQEIGMFQALDIPYTAVGWTLTDNIGTVRSSAAITPVVNILIEIETYITGGTVNGLTYPGMNVDVLTQLKVYIDRWLALGTTTTAVIGGGIAEITQVTDDPRDERRLLREFIRGLVPFYTKYAFDIKMAGDGASSDGAALSGGSSHATVEVIH